MKAKARAKRGSRIVRTNVKVHSKTAPVVSHHVEVPVSKSTSGWNYLVAIICIFLIVLIVYIVNISIDHTGTIVSTGTGASNVGQAYDVAASGTQAAASATTPEITYEPCAYAYLRSKANC